MSIFKALLSVLTTIWFFLNLAPGIQIPQDGGMLAGSPLAFFEEDDPALLGAASQLSQSYAGSFGTTALDKVTGCEGRSDCYSVCGVSYASTGDFADAGARYPFGFIARYDNSGNLTARAYVINSSLAVELTDICVLRNGNTVVCGYTYSSGTEVVNPKSFVSEYDTQLNLLCTKELEGTGSTVLNSVTSTSNGFVTGGRTASVNGEFTGTEYYGSPGAFLIRYKIETDSATGEHTFNKMWQKVITGEGTSEVACVSSDTNNNIYVSLSTNDDMGDYLAFEGLTGNSTDNVIVKYNGSGVMQWYCTLSSKGDDRFRSVYADPSGGCIVGGYVTGGKGSLGGTLSSLGYLGGYDSFIIRISSTGSITWAKSVSGSDDDYITSVVKCGSNYIAGGYSSSTSGAFSVNYGGTDGFAAVFSADGRQTQMINFGGSENDRTAALANTNGVLMAAGFAVSQDGYFDGMNQYAYSTDGSVVTQDMSDCFVSIWS